MRGSIQKKGKIYYAVIAQNNRRKWFKGGTKKDAQRVLTQKLSEIDQGTFKEIPKISFESFSELWLKNYAETSIKPSTLVSYQSIIRKLLQPLFSQTNLTDISPTAIQSYVAERLKIVSPKTVCNELVVIKEMFKHARRWGYIKNNPAEVVDRPRLTKTEIEILNPEEFEKLLSNSGRSYQKAFLTAILTGMRAGELWALQWGDIDWNSKQIFVRRSLWRGVFQTPKSKNSIRKIDMSDILVHELKIWKLACPINDHDLVFPSPEGKTTCHDNVVKRYFNPALRQAGLRHVSFHSSRHTNASLRIQGGQNIKYLSLQLGHASINITIDTNGHLFNFNDANFNRQQVGLLEDSFKSVRKTFPKNKKGFRESL